MFNTTTVWLSPEEIKQCGEFSEKSAQNQQAIEFGQKTTVPRKTKEIARDNMIGKMAEVAVAKVLMERYKIHVDLDFNYYPRGQWDEQDLSVNGWSMDVKAVREFAKWLFVDWNKLVFRQRDGNLSHVYVACTVGWNRDEDEPKGWVRIEGFASLDKLRIGREKTEVFRKGDLIPGTNTILQADNFGIRFSDLAHDMDSVVGYITRNSPPTWLTRNFKNPYTTQ